jgi:hypothetical protein
MINFLYTFTIHLYMHIFRRIFLSNYWWQESDIWSQASDRYPISWEAFFDPSDSYFLFVKERGYHKFILLPSDSLPNSHTAMKLSSPVFFPCKNPRYNAKLAYRHPPRWQKIKWSIYCWLSLDIMPISYVTRQWFYR